MILDSDERECVCLAIEYFLKKDKEFDLVNGWTKEMLEGVVKKLDKRVKRAYIEG